MHIVKTNECNCGYVNLQEFSEIDIGTRFSHSRVGISSVLGPPLYDNLSVKEKIYLHVFIYY